MVKQMNHAEYKRKTKTLSSESLKAIIADCQETISINPENPNNGYYADEISYCAMELHRRSKLKTAVGV